MVFAHDAAYNYFIVPSTKALKKQFDNVKGPDEETAFSLNLSLFSYPSL